MIRLNRTAREKLPTNTAIWHKAERAYIWDEQGFIRFTDEPKFLSTLSKAKARVRCDYGLDERDVEYRTRADIERNLGREVPHLGALSGDSADDAPR